MNVPDGSYPTNVGGSSAIASVNGTSATAPVTVSQVPVTAATVNLSLTAAPSTSPAGGNVGYAIQLANTSSSAVALTTVVVKLPAGFDYVAGTTTGALSNEPTVLRSAAAKSNGEHLRAAASPTVTWNGPMSIPANSTVTVNFKSSIASDVVAGTYTSDVSGAASGGVAVNGLLATAPVTVTGASALAATPVPVGSPWMLLLLTVLLAGWVGARQRRGGHH